MTNINWRITGWCIIKSPRLFKSLTFVTKIPILKSNTWELFEFFATVEEFKISTEWPDQKPLVRFIPSIPFVYRFRNKEDKQHFRKCRILNQNVLSILTFALIKEYYTTYNILYANITLSSFTLKVLRTFSIYTQTDYRKSLIQQRLIAFHFIFKNTITCTIVKYVLLRIF